MQTMRKELYKLINEIPDEELHVAADCLKLFINSCKTSDISNIDDLNKEEIYPLEVISQLAVDMGYEDLSENFEAYTRRKVIIDE